MKARRGISPVIATVIIVAVAIAISIAVAGWLMGLWGTFGATEQLIILPNSTITVLDGDDNDYLNITIKNTGSRDAKIYMIEVLGLAKITNMGNCDIAGANEAFDGVVPQGSTVALECALNADAVEGTQYTVKVYTEAGNVYQGYVVASTP
jgi:flagellin-like protein